MLTIRNWSCSVKRGCVRYARSNTRGWLTPRLSGSAHSRPLAFPPSLAPFPSPSFLPPIPLPETNHVTLIATPSQVSQYSTAPSQPLGENVLARKERYSRSSREPKGDSRPKSPRRVCPSRGEAGGLGPLCVIQSLSPAYCDYKGMKPAMNWILATD